jgi:hypothetical protein
MALISVYNIRFINYFNYELRMRASILIICKIDYP